MFAQFLKAPVFQNAGMQEILVDGNQKLNSKQWKSAREQLSFAIGKDISGKVVVGELGKMPHLLIAGQTGSGKSVMINTLLSSLLYAQQ